MHAPETKTRTSRRTLLFTTAGFTSGLIIRRSGLPNKGRLRIEANEAGRIIWLADKVRGRAFDNLHERAVQAYADLSDVICLERPSTSPAIIVRHPNNCPQ
jgi:hypothetical protein